MTSRRKINEYGFIKRFLIAVGLMKSDSSKKLTELQELNTKFITRRELSEDRQKIGLHKKPTSEAV